MVKPWDSYDLIAENLKVLGGLKANEKIGRADNTGVYQVHRDNGARKRQDSITNLEADLTTFLRRAIYAAHCGTLGNCPHGPMLRTQIEFFRDHGLKNLEATYTQENTRGWLHKLNKKTPQLHVIGRLKNFILFQSNHRGIRTWIRETATQAFGDVRLRYKETYKSANKKYIELDGGKFQPGGDPTAFAKRLAMHDKAMTELDKQRDVRDREKMILAFTVDEIKKEIADTKEKLNVYIGPMFKQKTGYDDLAGGAREHTLRLVYDRLNPEDRKAFKKASAALATWQERLIERQNFTPLDPWKDKAGNCGELSTLARMKLQAHPFICVCVLSTRPGHVVKDQAGKDHQGDHQFTIFGLRLHGVQSFTRYKQPSPLPVITKASRAQIKAAYVVDPWANVCCPVDEYPSQFRARMLLWSNKGKQIRTGKEWIAPGEAANEWYARTVDELDWVVGEYQAWGDGVFTR